VQGRGLEAREIVLGDGDKVLVLLGSRPKSEAPEEILLHNQIRLTNNQSILLLTRVTGKGDHEMRHSIDIIRGTPG
jgi:hypothetical protein